MEFKVEFERRLIKLQFCLDNYFTTGHVGNLFPALFSVFSYLWCKSPYKK